MRGGGPDLSYSISVSCYTFAQDEELKLMFDSVTVYLHYGFCSILRLHCFLSFTLLNIVVAAVVIHSQVTCLNYRSC